MSRNGRDLTGRKEEEWVCFHILSGHESKFARHLFHRNLNYFLPLLVTKSSAVLRTLWPGYVFARVTLAQMHELLSHESVCRSLQTAFQDRLLEDLRQFGALNHMAVTPQEGDAVEMRNGCLRFSPIKVHRPPSEGKVALSTPLMGVDVVFEAGVDEIATPDGSLFPRKIVPVAEQLEQVKEARKIFDLTVSEISAEMIRYLSAHPDLLYTISPRRFEELVAELLKDMGLDVTLTPETRDGGRDILAVLATPIGKLLTIVECKRHAADRPVGIDIVERFMWAIERKDKASCGLIATTSHFSPEALRLEKEFSWRLKLRNFEGLKEWIGQYGAWSRGDETQIWVPRTNTW